MRDLSHRGAPKVPVHPAGRGPARVVVNSLGSAGVGLIRSLRHVLPYSDADIAALLFQAPSLLLAGLEPQPAEAIAGLLRETGLDCAVLAPDAVILGRRASGTTKPRSRCAR